MAPRRAGRTANARFVRRCAKWDSSKAEIRALSREIGLPTWDKPAMPCLSSRIPYGTPVTAEALHLIGRAEAHLRALGFKQLRVRHYVENEKPTARLEIEPAEMPVVFENYENYCCHTARNWLQQSFARPRRLPARQNERCDSTELNHRWTSDKHRFQF